MYKKFSFNCSDGIHFDPPAGCWLAPGFRYLWRYHDAGQHNILKERVFKPVVKATKSPLIALGASFFLITYWHTPLPFAFESPSGLPEDDWDNYHVVKAMVVFGLGKK